MSSAKKPCTGDQREAKEGSSEDHVAVDVGEGIAIDGKDLKQHFSHGQGAAEVEASRCCPTRQLA